MDLTEQMRARILARGEEPVLCYDDTWYNQDQFSAVATEIDELLLAHQIGPGASIGIYMRNRPGPVVALAVSLATRRPLVVLNPDFPDATMGDDVIALRPVVVVADPADWNRSALHSAVTEVGALG